VTPSLDRWSWPAARATIRLWRWLDCRTLGTWQMATGTEGLAAPFAFERTFLSKVVMGKPIPDHATRSIFPHSRRTRP